MFKERYIEVKYEKLITDPEYEIRRICNFLNVPYCIEILDYQKSAKEITSNDEIQWKKETFRKLQKENYNKWKKDLSIWEIALVETVCSKNLIEGDYEISNAFDDLSIVQRIAVLLLIFGFKFADLIYCLLNVNNKSR